MPTLAIYTVLTGSKEPLGNPVASLESEDTDLDIDLICFTDDHSLKSNVWQCRAFDTHSLSPERSSRRPKALPHEYLPTYDYSLYIDNICELKRLPKTTDLVKAADADYVYRLFKHSSRDYVWQEAVAITSLGYDMAETLIKQLDAYSQTIPVANISPLGTCTLLLREHNHQKVKIHGALWWDHITTFSQRDQMSFDFCRLTTDLKVTFLAGNKFQNDLIHPHNNATPDRILASIDSLKYKRLLTAYSEQSAKESGKDRAHELIKEKCTRDRTDLEMLSYLCGSDIGSYHGKQRAITASLQRTLQPLKYQIKKIIGIFSENIDNAGFSYHEAEACQRTIQLFLGAHEIVTERLVSIDALEATMLKYPENSSYLICFYNSEAEWESTLSVMRTQRKVFWNGASSYALRIPNKIKIAPINLFPVEDLLKLPPPQSFHESPMRAIRLHKISDKQHVIYCDGGLANRVYTLVFGLILMKKYGHSWQVSWPPTNVCNARLEQLFVAPIDTNERTISYYKSREAQYNKVVHHNFGNFDDENLILNSSLSSYSDYAALLNDRNVFYMHNSLPNFVEIGDVANALYTLIPAFSVQQSAAEFISRYKLGPEVIGLHLRKTDFHDKVNEDHWYNLAQASTEEFFVCSDDQGILQKFRNLENCIVSPASSFPDKIFENAPWGACVQQPNSDEILYNMNRSSGSVICGLIDLLLLSKTTIVKTSNSSFLHLASILHQIKYIDKFLFR
jgi:hypothetical protein